MKGFLPPILMIALVFIFLMALPIILGTLNPTFKWIMIAYFCMVVFLFVRRILGGGILTFVISGILIYIFVIQMWQAFAAVYMLYLLVNFMLSGILIFGLQGTGVGRKAGAVR